MMSYFCPRFFPRKDQYLFSEKGAGGLGFKDG